MYLCVGSVFFGAKGDCFCKRSKGRKKVLFISSYSYDWESVPKQIEGLKTVLEPEADIHYIFMNTRHIGDYLGVKLTYDEIKAAMHYGQGYDAVIVGDDAALRFALKYQEDLFFQVPIVFEGINDLALANTASQNEWMTGVVEKMPFEETIRLALSLYPNSQTIIGIVDNTMMGNVKQDLFLRNRNTFSALSFSVLNTSEFDKNEIAEKIQSIDEKAIVLLLSFGEDENHMGYDGYEREQILMDYCSAPVFCINILDEDEAVLGGTAVSYEKLGEAAGTMAKEILEGRPVGEIPIDMDTPIYTYFNYLTMKRLNISPSKVPKDTYFLHRKESFTEKYHGIILTAEVLSSLFSILLLLIFWKNFRKEKIRATLIAAQTNFQNMMDDMPGGICMFEVEESIIYNRYYNDGLCEMFGYNREEMEQHFTIEHSFFMHEQDWGMVENTLKSCHKWNEVVTVTFRRCLKNGEVRWTNLIAKLIESGKRRLFYCVFVDVNPTKEDELRAKLEHEKYQIALDNTSLNIWEYDPVHHRRIQISHCDYLMDYPRIIENYPETILESGRIHPDSVDIYLALHEKIQQGAASAITEVKVCNMEGDYSWYRIKYVTLYDDMHHPIKAIGISEDISEQEKYKEELYQIQEICNYTVQNKYRYVATLDLKRKMIRIFFENGRNINGVNETPFEIMFSEYLQSIDEGERVHFQKYWNLETALKEIEMNNGVLRSTYQYTENGVEKWAEFKCTYFHNKKDTLLILVTELSQLLQNEKKSKELLETALEEAKEAARAKEEFLSFMSHEIRTPLNGIRGMLDLLKQKEEFMQVSYLDDAIISAKHLSGLVNDILDLSRIEHGKLMLHKTNVKMSELLHYVEAVITPMAKEKNIHFIREYDAEAFGEVMIDQGRMQQILINVLANGVKYTKSGGFVRLSMKEKKMKHAQVLLTFTVEDNGIGMSEEFLKRAFDPFEQADHAFYQNGSGLGLCITKRLVEAMEGEIKLTSKLSKGTKLVIRICAEENTMDTIKASALREKVLEPNHFLGVRALLVEDNEINREIAKMQLEYLGVSVDTAFHGEEAVTLFTQSTMGTYQIIFMDIMMPVMNGVEAARKIRSLDREDAKKIPIVAMTANAFADDLHESFYSGMNHYLSKPFERDQMIDILAQEFL